MRSGSHLGVLGRAPPASPRIGAPVPPEPMRIPGTDPVLASISARRYGFRRQLGIPRAGSRCTTRHPSLSRSTSCAKVGTVVMMDKFDPWVCCTRPRALLTWTITRCSRRCSYEPPNLRRKRGRPLHLSSRQTVGPRGPPPARIEVTAPVDRLPAPHRPTTVFYGRLRRRLRAAIHQRRLASSTRARRAQHNP